MRLEFTEPHEKPGTTMIYVTHDRGEAMTMADKIVVLQAGRIEKVGTPLELYSRPRNKFVAGFIGSPRMNFLTGAEAQKHDATTIGLRPEQVALSRDTGRWQGRVNHAEHLGSDTFLHVDTDFGVINVRSAGEIGVHRRDTVWLSPQPGTLHRFDAGDMAFGELI